MMTNYQYSASSFTCATPTLQSEIWISILCAFCSAKRIDSCAYFTFFSKLAVQTENVKGECYISSKY